MELYVPGEVRETYHCDTDSAGKLDPVRRELEYTPTVARYIRQGKATAQ